MQLTQPAARALIAGTRARYRTRLGDRLRTATVAALKASTPGDEANTAHVVMADSLAAYVRDLLMAVAWLAVALFFAWRTVKLGEKWSDLK
jgi:hypothetical protein